MKPKYSNRIEQAFVHLFPLTPAEKSGMLTLRRARPKRSVKDKNMGN